MISLLEIELVEFQRFPPYVTTRWRRNKAALFEETLFSFPQFKGAISGYFESFL